MTSSIDRFSPQLLQNLDELKKLFTGEKEIQKIQNLPPESFIRSKDSLYLSRWQVAWIIVTAPFRLVAYVFISIIATSMGCLGIGRVSKPLQLFANYHLFKDLNVLLVQFLYGKKFLIASVNDYREDLTDIYHVSPINRKDLPEEMQKKLFSERLHFDRIGVGLCRGGVDWFNFLLFKVLTEKAFDFKNHSFVECVKSVAAFFENGQPRQAALLQSLLGLENDLLDVKSDFLPISSKWLRSKEKVSALLTQLPYGIYSMRIFDGEKIGHSISYIKASGIYLIWDPARGLIEFENTDAIADFMNSYYPYETLSVHFARQESKTPKKSFLSRIFNPYAWLRKC